MNNKERDRLNYKPNIELKQNIHTYYDKSVIISQNNLERTEGDINAAILNNKPAVSPVLKLYKQYNPAKILQDLNNINEVMDVYINNIKQKLIQNNTYVDMPDTMVNNDIMALDNYINLADNISGDINAELYPVLISLKQEIQQLMNALDKYIFNNNTDMDELDMLIDIRDNIVNTIIKAEEDGQSIDYKSIQIDTQVIKFAQDRTNTFIEMLNNLLMVDEKDIGFLLPKDPDLIADYYDNIKTTNIDDRRKMEWFTSTNIISKIIDDIYDLKTKVLHNREIIKTLSRGEFIAILPIIKDVEDKLTNKVLDLYKAQETDSINKTDYIGTLMLKNNIRKFYNNQVTI